MEDFLNALKPVFFYIVVIIVCELIQLVLVNGIMSQDGITDTVFFLSLIDYENNNEIAMLLIVYLSANSQTLLWY